MNIRRILTGSAVIAVLAAQPIAASAAPAVSADASANVANEAPNWTPSNIGVDAMACYDDDVVNGPGGTSVKNAIWLRNGPGQGCDNASNYTLQPGTRLGGWCYTYNESGNKWYYVSVGGEAPYGWIYAGNVTSDASSINTPCR
ncbi:hypothetical protein [Streptomyces sp. SP18CS02]|uniref:hypothetical protein n=1 Tax=Streptomyces sp. SP18CS02 TaxID=3002531 RepID=UPI002E784996|nr:hypothetical protein [Streptomyces sp. SP18CS02]MEE1751201.1 hypothetical protein [Streptomyces sp. SP18CS02]